MARLSGQSSGRQTGQGTSAEAIRNREKNLEDNENYDYNNSNKQKDNNNDNNIVPNNPQLYQLLLPRHDIHNLEYIEINLVM